MLTVSDPTLFIGMLIGGAVPFLFSSMTIRAVGRAAFLIVKECRIQFRDKEIWAGTKKPDYGRVVDICTARGPEGTDRPGAAGHARADPRRLLPRAASALAGFLGGMIVVGQLLAVFMANAGGAWDNAKKMIEDEPRTETTGKGSEKHKAAVTGDTVGDPLKDTAGPAINPLIKVMNMVVAAGDRLDHRQSRQVVALRRRRRRSASWSSPGPSGGPRPRARSSARWRPSSPAPPRRAWRPWAPGCDCPGGLGPVSPAPEPKLTIPDLAFPVRADREGVFSMTRHRASFGLFSSFAEGQLFHLAL